MKLILVLFLVLWSCGLAALLSTVGFWFAAASQILPDRKSAYGWNPLNATINPANLTDQGKIYRKKAMRYGFLFLALTVIPLAIGFAVKISAMIASSLK